MANRVFVDGDIAEVMLDVVCVAFAAEALTEAAKQITYDRDRIHPLGDYPLTTTVDLDDSYAFTRGSVSDRYESDEFWILIDCLRKSEANLLRFIARAGRLSPAFRSAAHDWMQRYRHGQYDAL